MIVGACPKMDAGLRTAIKHEYLRSLANYRRQQLLQANDKHLIKKQQTTNTQQLIRDIKYNILFLRLSIFLTHLF